VFGLDRDGNPHHGPQVNGFAELKTDGSTASGCWIYSGVLGRDGVKKRIRGSPGLFGDGWGFAWQAIAGSSTIARVRGQTGVPGVKKKLVWWDSENGPVLMLPICSRKTSRLRT